MHQSIFKVVAASGNVLISNATRYEADKALFEAKGPAQMFRSGHPLAVVDNHEYFPFEPADEQDEDEDESTWTPVTSRLPEQTDKAFDRSAHVLFTDGVTHYTGHYYADEETPEDWGHCPRWIISGPDGYTVDNVTHWQPLPKLP